MRGRRALGLEVDAELREALRRLHPEVGARSREELVRERVVVDVEVGVDARAAGGAPLRVCAVGVLWVSKSTLSSERHCVAFIPRLARVPGRNWFASAS